MFEVYLLSILSKNMKYLTGYSLPFSILNTHTHAQTPPHTKKVNTRGIIRTTIFDKKEKRKTY